MEELLWGQEAAFCTSESEDWAMLAPGVAVGCSCQWTDQVGAWGLSNLSRGARGYLAGASPRRAYVTSPLLRVLTGAVGKGIVGIQHPLGMGEFSNTTKALSDPSWVCSSLIPF